MSRVTVAIVRRFERDGRTFRVLECGHEQRQHPGNPAKTCIEAVCRACADAARRASAAAPADTRTELQRFADDVERTWYFPAGRAWSLSDVAVRKLIDCARRHSCASPAVAP